MKTKIVGRHYSRRIVREPETEGELIELLKEGTIQRDIHSRQLSKLTFEEEVEGFTGIAADNLRRRGILCSPEVFKVKDGYQEERPDSSEYKYLPIEKYVRDELGFADDSIEDLSARVVWSNHLRKTLPPEADFHKRSIFELGSLFELLKVYSKEMRINQGNAQKKRRRLWAEALAQKLLSENPGVGFKSLWLAIPDDKSPIKITIAADGKEYIVYREEEDGKSTLIAEHGYDSERLSMGSFRTGYIVPASKK